MPYSDVVEMTREMFLTFSYWNKFHVNCNKMEKWKQKKKCQPKKCLEFCKNWIICTSDDTPLHCHVLSVALLFQPAAQIQQSLKMLNREKKTEWNARTCNWLEYFCSLFDWITCMLKSTRCRSLTLFAHCISTFAWILFVQRNHLFKCNKIQPAVRCNKRFIFILFSFFRSRRRHHIFSLEKIFMLFLQSLLWYSCFYYCRIKNGLFAGKMTYVNKIVYQVERLFSNQQT